MARKVRSPELSAYIAARINRHLQDEGMTATKLAETAGLTSATISILRHQVSGPGMKALTGLARAWESDIGALERAALVYAETGELLTDTASSEPSRCPNLEAAILALGESVGPDTTDVARRMCIESHVDLSPGTWASVLLDLESR